MAVLSLPFALHLTVIYLLSSGRYGGSHRILDTTFFLHKCNMDKGSPWTHGDMFDKLLELVAFYVAMRSGEMFLTQKCEQN